MSFWYNIFKQGVNKMKPKISLSKSPVNVEELTEPNSDLVAGSNEPEEVKEEVIEYTHEALSMHKNKYDEWVIVSIKFNPKLGKVDSIINELSVVSDKGTANEKFRIAVVSKGIL